MEYNYMKEMGCGGLMGGGEKGEKGGFWCEMGLLDGFGGVLGGGRGAGRGVARPQRVGFGLLRGSLRNPKGLDPEP